MFNREELFQAVDLWKKTGSIKKDFKLDAEDILRAEQSLARAIARTEVNLEENK
jgi:hypothetical protein